MERVYGNILDFTLVRNEASRVVISFDLKPTGDDVHGTWSELYYYKKRDGVPTLEQIKPIVLQQTNERIVNDITSGFVWQGHSVWLSTENQFNYQSAADVAVMTDGANLPVTFKFGSDEEPDYVEFSDISTLRSFWLEASTYISQTLADGWEEKDAIDWDEYERLLKEISQ